MCVLDHYNVSTRKLKETVQFYEDVLGFPLIATWCESDLLFGERRTYCHCFFGIGDGGALAFFQFERPEDQEAFGPTMPFTPFAGDAEPLDNKELVRELGIIERNEKHARANGLRTLP